jgi:hypothetical protein
MRMALKGPAAEGMAMRLLPAAKSNSLLPIGTHVSADAGRAAVAANTMSKSKQVARILIA